MAIAIDGSTPAGLGRVSNASPYTTASFSPPAGSLVVILAAAGWSNPGPVSLSCTSSTGGGAWTSPVGATGATATPGAVRIFYRYFAAAPGSMTVSVAYTGFGTGNCEMVTPIVFSGAHSIQTAAAVASATPTNSTSGLVTITTTRKGSYVWGVSVDEDTNANWTPNANTLKAQEFRDVTNAVHLLSFAATALTVTPGALTVGGTWSTTDASNTAAFEVLPAPTFVNIGQAVETDTANTVTPRKARGLSQATETDTANLIVPRKSLVVVQAFETDTANIVTPAKARAITQALETDIAFAITPVKLVAIGQAFEIDTAFGIEPFSPDSIGQAVETDTAHVITPTKSLLMGLATESDTANPIVAIKSASLGQAVETDIAFEITVRKTTVFRLVPPTAAKGYALEQSGLGDRGPTFRIPTAFTVYGSGSSLQYGESPPGHVLDAAEYVWYGGYDNMTDDPVIRALWLANGFEVQNVS